MNQKDAKKKDLTEAEVNSWAEAWLKERKKFPLLLYVKIQDPPKENDIVTVWAAPDISRRNKRSQKELEDPVALLREKLSPSVANGLRTALTNIQNWQEIDLEEGLACMIQKYVWAYDFVGSRKGWVSIFKRNYQNRTNKTKDSIIRVYPELLLQHILKYWNEHAGMNARGHEIAPGIFARPSSYKLIPYDSSNWIRINRLGNRNNGSKRLAKDIGDHVVAWLTTKTVLGDLAKFKRPGLTEDPRNSDKENNVFRKDGMVWTIVYQGKKFGHFQNIKGMRLIGYLIANRGGAGFYALKLEELIDNAYSTRPKVLPSCISDEELEELGKMSQDELAEIYKMGRGQFPARQHDIVDQQTIWNIRQKFSEYRKRLKEAKKDNDLVRVGEIETDINKLNKETSKIISPYTEAIKMTSRKFSDEKQKAHGRVAEAIKLALKKIKNENEDLWRHLHNAILPLKIPISYTPDQPIDWTTE